MNAPSLITQPSGHHNTPTTDVYRLAESSGLDTLNQLKTPWYLASFSALDRYYRKPAGENLYVMVRGSIVDLAREVADLTYPGLDQWDACLPSGEGAIHFRCVDEHEPIPQFGFGVLDFLFDPRADVFLDRADAYQELREKTVSARQPHEPGSLYEAAVLAARYGLAVPQPDLPTHSADVMDIDNTGSAEDISPQLQRRLFIDLLTGEHGEQGLALLMKSGAVARLWPELQPMNDTGHSKEHHPEGNVWEHTLETLRYRKTQNLTLAAALLLHDSGKPYSERTRERAFDKHAEIGARTAERLLRRLGFSAGFVSDVDWLIRNHMLPGALHRLPTYRSERAMASPLFPLLLELYRCDLCSTYRGPDGYYRACRVYRTFLKNRANPFRSADGKKLLRLYVE